MDTQPLQGKWSLAWFREMDSNGRKAFIASLGGWSTDAFDFMVFSFAITSLISLWGIERGQAGLLGTATLLSSSIGG